MKVSKELIESLSIVEQAISSHYARLMQEEAEKLDDLITNGLPNKACRRQVLESPKNKKRSGRRTCA